MRVMLWDVRVGGDRRLELLERPKADILILLGVSKKSSRAWSDRWAGDYQTAAGLHLTSSRQGRPHGAMIASRWPIRDAFVLNRLPRPERGLVTRIEHPNHGQFTVISWGTPNAAGDSREVKQAAYSLMNDFVRELTGPVVLGVDTNTWGDDPSPVATAPDDPDWAAENEFIARGAAHGLTDVHRALIDADEHRSRLLQVLRPHGPLAVTFVRRPHRSPRGISGSFEDGPAYGLDRMDRIYVSSEITPLACEHLYHEAVAAGGDHAAVVADLAFSY